MLLPFSTYTSCGGFDTSSNEVRKTRLAQCHAKIHHAVCHFMNRCHAHGSLLTSLLCQYGYYGPVFVSECLVRRERQLQTFVANFKLVNVSLKWASKGLAITNMSVFELPPNEYCSKYVNYLHVSISLNDEQGRIYL